MCNEPGIKLSNTTDFDMLTIIYTGFQEMRGDLFRFSEYNSFGKTAEFRILLRIGIVNRSKISRLVYVFSGGTSSTSSATSPLMTPVSGVASGNSTSNGGEPRPQPQPSTSRGGSSSSFRYHSFIT